MASSLLRCTFVLLSVLSLTACGRSGIGEDATDVPFDSGTDGDVKTCVTNSDCVDDKLCTEDLCIGGKCEHRAKDQDKDGFQDKACGGTDCNDLDPLSNPKAGEKCGDGMDNDCDGLVDCKDPDCASDPICSGPCVPEPGIERNCVDGRDNDCNGLVDCADPACKPQPA